MGVCVCGGEPTPRAPQSRPHPGWRVPVSAVLTGSGRTDGQLRSREASRAAPDAPWKQGRETEDPRLSPALRPQRPRPFHLTAPGRRPCSLTQASLACCLPFHPCPHPPPGSWASGREVLVARAPTPFSLFQQLPGKSEMCLAPRPGPRPREAENASISISVTSSDQGPNWFPSGG